MRYRITTPVRGFRGEVAGVAFIDSKAEVDEAANARALAYFRRKGYRVDPVEQAPAPAAAVERQPADDEPQRPGKNANKEALVAYAVAELDMAEEDANAKTRVELLDLIDKHEKESEQ
jgi:predicted cobalt transporter CbtA